jgi:hypothetical protein
MSVRAAMGVMSGRGVDLEIGMGLDSWHHFGDKIT